MLTPLIGRNKSMDKDTQNMMYCHVNDNLSFTPNVTNTTSSTSSAASPTLSIWSYWQDYYYPRVIRESYPVYIQERAVDKGKQAFEIIKMLKDKKFIKLDTVGNFIDAMDALIKIL